MTIQLRSPTGPRKKKSRTTKPTTTIHNASRSARQKNFKVALETVCSPQIQIRIAGLQIGITLNKLLITTEVQKLVCARAKT